jgi:hypothetical protein
LRPKHFSCAHKYGVLDGCRTPTESSAKLSFDRAELLCRLTDARRWPPHENYTYIVCRWASRPCFVAKGRFEEARSGASPRMAAGSERGRGFSIG